MIPIKFRGVLVDVDATVSGDLIHDGNLTYICNPCGKFLNASQVKPESVCQLVGYDKNGTEVYEGDTVYFEGNEDNPFRIARIRKRGCGNFIKKETGVNEVSDF